MPATIEIESETNLEILMATDPRPMFDCELDIAACDIAAPSLSDRLSHLLIENVIDSEDDIFVKEGFGFPIWIAVQADVRWLRFHGFFETRLRFDERVRLVNRLNLKSASKCAQFSTPDDATIIQAYFFHPYEDRLMMKSVMRLAREFALALRVAMEDFWMMDSLSERVADEATVH